MSDGYELALRFALILVGSVIAGFSLAGLVAGWLQRRRR